jgi:hypothetical protein
MNVFKLSRARRRAAIGSAAGNAPAQVSEVR